MESWSSPHNISISAVVPSTSSMFKNILLFVCATACFTIANSASFITKCTADDFKCLKESTQNAIQIFASGIPELDVEKLDPVFFDVIDTSAPSLKLILKDVTVKGLSNCVAKKIQRNAAKSQLYLRFVCSATLDGDYEMKGRLLVLPIEGKGKVHVTFRKVNVNVDADLDEVDGKDNKKHWAIKNWVHSFELKDKSDVVFENLFNGNELLGKAASDLIAENGNDIIIEIGPPVIKTVIERIVDNVAKLFKNVPLEDLTLD